MKKITLLAIAFVAISFASCRKSHVCVCQFAGSTTKTIVLPSQTGSEAKATCSSYDPLYGTCTVQ